MIFGHQPDWSKWQKVSNPETEIELPVVEFDAVTGWRFGFLCGLGFDPETALTMAESPQVDLRDAENLVRAGCPLETAVGILL